jgi:hypothetical protein
MLLLENEKKYENINQLLAFGAERFTLRLAPFQPPVIEALYERDKKDSSWPDAEFKATLKIMERQLII